MEGTLIRPAAPADLETIGRLGALLVREHHDFDLVDLLGTIASSKQATSLSGKQYRA